MERNKKDKKDKNVKPLWRKITTPTLTIRTPRLMRILYKGLIHATREELGNRLDGFELIKNGTGKYKIKKDEKGDLSIVGQKKGKEPDLSEGYTLEHVSNGWYNVLSPKNKVMNEKKLRAEDAKTLKKELEAQIDE